MKRIYGIALLLAVGLAFLLNSDLKAEGKKGLNAVNVKLTCKSGQVYTTTLNKDKTFSFKGVDDDCDGATIELINPNINPTASKRPGRAKFSNIVMKRGMVNDKTNPLHESKGNEAQNPLYKGKSSAKSSLYEASNFVGDLDGDGAPEDVCIKIEKVNKELKGSLCGNTDHF